MLLAARSTPFSRYDDDREDDDEEHDVADPPERHRGLRSATMAALRAMPGSAPRMTSNCALIAVDRALERAQVLGLDALERRGQRREALGDARQARGGRSAQRPAPRRRRRRGRRTGATRMCSLMPPVPVGEGVHVAVLDDGLLDDQRQHGRGRLELRDVRGVRGDLAGDLEQVVDRPLDAREARIRSASSTATTSAATRPTDEGDRPVAVARDGGDRSPTATFRSARAACRIRTPESLICAMPPSSAVCCRTTSTAPSAVPPAARSAPREPRS